MASILYRCSMCDPDIRKPNPVEVAGNDPPVSACYQAVIRDHALKCPDCPAIRTSEWVAIDFLIRMVQ